MGIDSSFADGGSLCMFKVEFGVEESLGCGVGVVGLKPEGHVAGACSCERRGRDQVAPRVLLWERRQRRAESLVVAYVLGIERRQRFGQVERRQGGVRQNHGRS